MPAAPTPAPIPQPPEAPAQQLETPEGDAEAQDHFQEYNADGYYKDRVPADGGYEDSGNPNANIVPLVLACVGILAAMFVFIKFFLMFF